MIAVVALAALGTMLAGGGAVLAGHLAKRQDGHALLPLLAIVGLLLACTLPFAWVALFGRG